MKLNNNVSFGSAILFKTNKKDIESLIAQLHSLPVDKDISYKACEKDKFDLLVLSGKELKYDKSFNKTNEDLLHGVVSDLPIEYEEDRYDDSDDVGVRFDTGNRVDVREKVKRIKEEYINNWSFNIWSPVSQKINLNIPGIDFNKILKLDTSSEGDIVASIDEEKLTKEKAAVAKSNALKRAEKLEREARELRSQHAE